MRSTMLTKKIGTLINVPLQIWRSKGTDMAGIFSTALSTHICANILSIDCRDPKCKQAHSIIRTLDFVFAVMYEQ